MDARLVRSGPDSTLVLEGEIDFSSVPELEAVLHMEVQRLDRSGGTLLIDASRLAFIDVRAFEALARAAERLGPGRAILTGASSIVRRVVELTERFLPAAPELALARSA
jgi:anti-anti-sigma factor